MSTIAFFIPHRGCPHQCSFCNQHAISRKTQPPLISEIATTLEAAATERGEQVADTEIAFFGGSFTAIPREEREKYLAVGAAAVEKFGYRGIRCSTRPDAISPQILKELAGYPVTTIELGAQSMNDVVLSQNFRGHTAQDVKNAAALVKESGYQLILQMMVGLYGENPEDALETAEEIILLQPHGVRIYPTLVLPETYLEELYLRGEYQPLTLLSALAKTAKLLDLFENAGIPVIRVGLHNQENLSHEIIQGPHHPAFRELCQGERYAQQIKERLKQSTTQGIVSFSPKDQSVFSGHGQRLMKQLKKEGFQLEYRRDSLLNQGSIHIEPIFFEKGNRSCD